MNTRRLVLAKVGTAKPVAEWCLAVPVAIFILTGLLKLSVLWWDDRFLRLANPVFFPLPNRFVLGIAAILEVAVGTTAWAVKRRSPRAGFLLCLWLISILALYRFGLVLSGVRPSTCGCLGLLEKIFLPTGWINGVTLGLLLLACATSVFGLLACGDGARHPRKG